VLFRRSILLLGIDFLLAADASLALPDWLLPSGLTDVRQVAASTAIHVSYAEPAPVPRVIAGFQERLKSHGVPCNPRFDGMGTSISTEMELAPGRTLALVIKIRSDNSGSQVIVDGALKLPPPADSSPPSARVAVSDSEVPPLQPEWPDWLAPMPGSRPVGGMMEGRGKACVFWTSEHPNRPCLFQKYRIAAAPLDIWNYYTALCKTNRYGVAMGSGVTPQVWVLGPKSGEHTGRSEGHIEAVRLTIKEALTKPGTSFPDSYDSNYKRLVIVTIGGSKDGTEYSLMVSVDNGR